MSSLMWTNYSTMWMGFRSLASFQGSPSSREESRAGSQAAFTEKSWLRPAGRARGPGSSQRGAVR